MRSPTRRSSRRRSCRAWRGVKQTWGTAHVTDVLTGRATEKVVAAGHDRCRRSGC